MKFISRAVAHTVSFLASVAVTMTPLGVAAQLDNPVNKACNELSGCIMALVNYALGLAGVLALAGIVWGGFLYITAAGNQDRVESGKNAIYYSILGLLVIGLSYAILSFIFSALGGGGGGGGGFPRAGDPGGSPR